MSFRPLLGWNKPFDLSDVHYPVFASYKLDGWRAWRIGNEFFSRNSKTIPNRDLQRRFADLPEIGHLDGELISGNPGRPDVFRDTDRLCKTFAAPADSIRWFVFDHLEKPDEPFHRRLSRIVEQHPLVVKLDQVECRNEDDVLRLEQVALENFYEGLCLRSPTGRYKYGRSTFKEQYLLKLKRFLDGEATVTGFNEALRNTNEATSNALGLTERSSHQEGLVPMGTLGSLEVEMGGVQFRVGTGFTEADRREIWQRRDHYLGKRCTIKYSPILKDKPRQPRFKGWRNDL